MKNALMALISCLPLTACTTPQMVMKNPRNGQVQVCGGNSTSSINGGMIGYHFQLQDDAKCVETFKKQGFKTLPKPLDKEDDKN